MNTRTIIIRTLVLLVAATLAGCAPYSLIKPEPQTVGGTLSVVPGTPWNKVRLDDNEGKIETWTLDGPVLNRLIFFEGVGDGEPLLQARSGLGGSAKRDEKPPVFRSKMNPFEVQELLQATIARRFQTTIVDSRNLRPIQFADRPGFRFDTKFTGRDEVERKGVFTGSVGDGRLYGVWFFGAGSHYFDRYLPEFTRLIDSARIMGTTAAAK